jgi:hypothetical protein
VSLFGWREKRHNKQLQRRVETLIEQRDDARKLAGIHQGNLVRMAQARAAQHEEVTRLRKEAADLGQMLTREVVEADEDVTAEGARAERYRLAWQSARNRAGVLGLVTAVRDDDALWLRGRLDRAVRACIRYRHDLAAQHRVNDRLSDQLMGSMGYSDVALSRLGVDLASTKAGGAS